MTKRLLRTDACRRPAGDRDVSRAKTAKLLGIHADTVTKRLGDGLASAVVKWGGHSKSMAFSALLLARLIHAIECPELAQRRPRCKRCALVLEDAEVCAAHHLEHRHGAFSTCADENCQRFLFCLPCGCPEQPVPRFKKPLLTKLELATRFGVSPLLIREWEAQGMLCED